MSKNPAKEMPLMGHLGELRRRITYIAIVVVVCVIAAFFLKDYILAILTRPLEDGGFTGKLAVLGVTEGFMQILKVSIYAGRDGSVTFAVDVPADAQGRHVLCADVTLGERRFGWLAEAIVDVTPPA